MKIIRKHNLIGYFEELIQIIPAQADNSHAYGVVLHLMSDIIYHQSGPTYCLCKVNVKLFVYIK